MEVAADSWRCGFAVRTGGAVVQLRATAFDRILCCVHAWSLSGLLRPEPAARLCGAGPYRRVQADLPRLSRYDEARDSGEAEAVRQQRRHTDLRRAAGVLR